MDVRLLEQSFELLVIRARGFFLEQTLSHDNQNPLIAVNEDHAVKLLFPKHLHAQSHHQLKLVFHPQNRHRHLQLPQHILSLPQDRTHARKMSQSPTSSPPSTRCRCPRSHIEQSDLDNATAWLNNSNRTPSTCPLQALTRLIATEASLGATTLIKYDPAKLTGLYGLMRKTERMHLVEDLRLDVSARTMKGRKWREVMVVARGMECEDPDLIWECLEMACQRAMDVGLELEERLRWCEREFEAEKLPARAVGEERVWNEGLEIQRRESEEGISLE
jgi:hypothetical protein